MHQAVDPAEFAINATSALGEFLRSAAESATEGDRWAPLAGLINHFAQLEVSGLRGRGLPRSDRPSMRQQDTGPGGSRYPALGVACDSPEACPDCILGDFSPSTSVESANGIECGVASSSAVLVGAPTTRFRSW